ncbi:MAG: hypothetical protein JST30_00045 [Armatimonadetes bacterium]|nr:hypothetical protein [Armatimonadota bacterium]
MPLPGPLELLQELVSLPGPPGQEDAVREAVGRHVAALGLKAETDPKGNLLVKVGHGDPKVVVTAHMDEIAMFVRGIGHDGSLLVGAMGGLHPWKLGEGPVQVLADAGPIDGVLGFGSVHTEAPGSVVRSADDDGLDWDMASVLTGLDPDTLMDAGVRPGTRVVVHPSRRGLTKLGELVAGYFLDDRADLVAWLLALEESKDGAACALFVATASEEVGGEGALYVLHRTQPDVCIALELGPVVDDAPVELNDQPTVWSNDSYAAMSPADARLLDDVASGLGLDLQFQALSRGGSDASCAASHGLCARPVTLGIPMANSHGYEVVHPRAMVNLARLTSALVTRLSSP